MPPKPKFERDEIIQAALTLVSRQGPEALTTRALSVELGSSARPIFTVFRNMEELQQEVRTAAMARYASYEDRVAQYQPVFRRAGMQMVLFASEEPKLYQLLFMQENRGLVGFADLYKGLGSGADYCIRAIESDYGLPEQDARRLFEMVWVYTFGVGALIATGACRFSEEELAQMLTADFTAAMMLIKPGR